MLVPFLRWMFPLVLPCVPLTHHHPKHDPVRAIPVTYSSFCPRRGPMRKTVVVCVCLTYFYTPSLVKKTGVVRCFPPPVIFSKAFT